MNDNGHGDINDMILEKVQSMNTKKMVIFTDKLEKIYKPVIGKSTN